jgi:hypothetical protein
MEAFTLIVTATFAGFTLSKRRTPNLSSYECVARAIAVEWPRSARCLPPAAPERRRYTVCGFAGPCWEVEGVPNRW